MASKKERRWADICKTASITIHAHINEKATRCWVALSLALAAKLALLFHILNNPLERLRLLRKVGYCSRSLFHGLSRFSRNGGHLLN